MKELKTAIFQKEFQEDIILTKNELNKNKFKSESNKNTIKENSLKILENDNSNTHNEVKYKEKEFHFKIPNRRESYISQNLVIKNPNTSDLNSKEILINEERLRKLPLDAIIYDGEIYRITTFRNTYKTQIRYCQITQKEIKYFSSIYSSSVWNDKPLLRIPIKNVINITIANEEITKLKYSGINLVFRLFLKFDESKFFIFLKLNF